MGRPTNRVVENQCGDCKPEPSGPTASCSDGRDFAMGYNLPWTIGVLSAGPGFSRDPSLRPPSGTGRRGAAVLSSSADRARDHQFLVRAQDADGDPAGVR